MWFSSLGVILNRIKSLMLNKLIEIITEDEYCKKRYGKEVICIFQTTERYFILCSRLELEFVYLRFHSFQLQKTSEQ